MRQDTLPGSSLSESGFKRNSALQLVLGIASIYIVFQIVVLVLMILSDAPRSMFDTHIIPYTGIWDWDLLTQRPYTLLTYTFCNKDFLVLSANCIWIYACGRSIDKRYGYMEVIPAYIFISIGSALLYTIVLKAADVPPAQFNTGAFTSLLGLSVSMIFRKDHYFKINQNLSVPYIVIFFILLGFSLIQYNVSFIQTWLLIGSSYAVGALYFLLVSRAFVGKRIYQFFYRLAEKMTPQFREEDILGWDIDELFVRIKERHPMIPEEKLDELFFKVRRNGFGSLSHMEKNIFFRLMND